MNAMSVPEPRPISTSPEAIPCSSFEGAHEIDERHIEIVFPENADLLADIRRAEGKGAGIGLAEVDVIGSAGRRRSSDRGRGNAEA
jgi:hypothetical protein